MTHEIIKPEALTTQSNIAIVVATFNKHITGKLLNGALETLKQNIPAENITVVHVPGAVEIAFATQQLAKTGKYQAIITLGAVIYGETDHYHYVCDQVNQGCLRVMETLFIKELLMMKFFIVLHHTTMLATRCIVRVSLMKSRQVKTSLTAPVTAMGTTGISQ